MIIKVYESDEFTQTESYEQRFVYFECRRNLEKEGYTFERFIRMIMTKEILIDSFYTLNLISNRKEVALHVDKDYKD